MPSITLTLSNTAANNEAIDNFCTRLGYNVLVDGTKSDFIKLKLTEYFKKCAGEHKSETDAQIARLAALLYNETNVIIT